MKHFFYSVALLALTAVGMTFTSCSSDDDNITGDNIDINGNEGDSGIPAVDPKDVSFIVTSSDPATDLAGGVYMKVFSDLSTTKTEQSVYGASDALKCADCFTQVTYNKTTNIFTGYIYARGASAEGIGSMQAGIRSYKYANGILTESADPVKVTAFGNTGTFGTYSYAAQISQPYAMVLNAAGSGNNIAVKLIDYAIDEVNPNISNIVDMGDNRIAMVLNYSNRDSAVVAICDYQLNITKVIYDDRIGTSVGAQRSVRYTQSGADDNGNIYVFSGSSAKDSRVGALRIKKGETEFDKNYKFDILTAADGYRFRKAFHISGSKFLLEFYTDKAKYGNMDASGKMAVVDMDTQTLTWVTGLPDASTVSFGWGDGYAGAYYLPVAAPTSMSGGSGSGSGGGWNHSGKSKATRATSSITPTIYKIDASTGVATAFMTFADSDLLKAITIIK